MKIHSIEFTENWSWGLIWSDMINQYSHIIKRTFMNDGGKMPESVSENDVVLCQNVTLLKQFKERLKTVCRMGGNYNFDGQDFEKLKPLLNEMSKCYCIIATNKKLYNIATAIHNNVFLVPNGIDLKQWYPCPKKEERPFTVGFCGNISNTFYREYKGYDRLRMACKLLGVELKEALYKDGQIPHDKMMKEFYWKIDCLVHPTLGEGSSNTISEACACGVPIITTREAGFHGEFMKDGYDVLFCTREIMDIKDKIQQLMNNKMLQEKLGRRSRMFAEKHHDIKVIAKKYEEIFQDCYRQNQKLHV